MLCFSFITLIIAVQGQQRLNNPQKGYPFGTLRSIVDLAATPTSSSRFSGLAPINQDQTFVPSCTNVRANVRQAHPFDQSKYYICRNQWKSEITTCPNGGLFDDRIKGCIDLCEQKKPCLNKGQCIIHTNLTLECVCRRDWTGDRCEIPLSTCSTQQPCGPDGECHMLKASDYTQDFVCICNKHESYGRNCQQTVPNPCITPNHGQFHPFAFSRRAYINCDDDIIFFQPCYGLLYWNQEDKRCDRALPELLKSSSFLSNMG